MVYVMVLALSGSETVACLLGHFVLWTGIYRISDKLLNNQQKKENASSLQRDKFSFSLITLIKVFIQTTTGAGQPCNQLLASVF